MINLLFTGNDKAFAGLTVALISIVKHCTEPLNVKVLTMDLSNLKPNYKPLSKKMVESLEKRIQEVNAESKIDLY